MKQQVFCYLRRVSGLLFLLVLVTVACAGQTREPTPLPTATTPPTEAPTVPPPPGDQPDAVIKRATEALAASLGVDTSAVALVSMERQKFPDAALGCVQPGEVAATIETEGYKVVLSAGDAQYELHTNLDGTMVRCLPTGTPVAEVPTVTPVPTLDDGVDKTAVETVETALESKDYERLKEVMSSGFWLGFYASEADRMTPEEALEKLKELYLGPGLVRVHHEVSVEKLLPEWSSAAPYARLVYSTGWGESQKDDAILLFEEQAGALYWAGMFYVFDGLKKSAYGDGGAELPAPPAQSLGAIADAIEGKAYEALKSLVTDPVFLGFYASEASQLSPHAFVEALQRNYLEPGEVKVRFDVDVTRLLPDWSADSSCVEFLYSTGWGEDQADDGILCLKNEPEGLRWGGMLYIFASLKETAYAEPPSLDEEEQVVAGMVYISAGSFIMGSNAGEVGAVQGSCLGVDPGCDAGQFEDETPQREVTLDAFYIDETEVAVADFRAFVAATGYQTTSEAKGDPVQYTWRAFDTPERQDHPVRWMSWHDANAYCQWAGKRLPTEAEWEKAARGTQGLLYPWGNEWDDARVPFGDAAPVTAFPDGASPYGVLSMAGGVWEWVADWYDPLYYQYGPTVNPTGPDETSDKVLRGGAFDNATWAQRTAHRHFGGATGYAHDHGFRCARDE
jgi:formylglycine-generating enzyme required for sulfatase activity